MKVGCHISIAGGIQNAPRRAADLGCETMQIFTRSPQGGKASELTKNIINASLTDVFYIRNNALL